MKVLQRTSTVITRSTRDAEPHNDDGTFASEYKSPALAFTTTGKPPYLFQGGGEGKSTESSSSLLHGVA